MELSSKPAAGAATPSRSIQSKHSETSKNSENVNPNVSSPNPSLKQSTNSPVIKSTKKPQNSAAVNPNPSMTPFSKKKIRERKFMIAKRKKSSTNKEESLNASGCSKCKKANGKSKCLCVAYENLRASQEEFFKQRSKSDLEKSEECNNGIENEVNRDDEIGKGFEGNGENEEGLDGVEANGKRRRERPGEEEEERNEPGSGRVMSLVKAFEKLLSVPKSSDSEEKEVKEMDGNRNRMKWGLAEWHQQVSSSSFCPDELFLTSESLGLDSRRTSSLDSSQGSFSILSRTSAGGRRSRRNSLESAGTFARRNRRRQQRATSQKPFMLRTEQRGKSKEEEFMKKVQQMMEEEEKLRVPVAQGLPWTTDEPEPLVKPPVKEITRPIDLTLHSDIRAEERAEFDHQVAEKMIRIEQYKMERERQQKLAEEEEIRRLRKELVPKAQPMPYFDRPFIPRRSEKQPTIPKEPKFHVCQHKKMKCSMSWSDFCTSQQ